jgi:hypothetical protein
MNKGMDLRNVILVFMFVVGCIDCPTTYETDDEENEEILDFGVVVNSDGDEVGIHVITCDIYGTECKDRRVIYNSIKLYPYFESLKDTLKFIRKKDVVFFFLEAINSEMDGKNTNS